jgi:hypothetical protein
VRARVLSVPGSVLSRAGRWRRTRWLDGVAAWILASDAMVALDPDRSPAALGVAIAVVIALATPIGPLRRRWRPISALMTFVRSFWLRPGDRAWLVTPDDVVPVTVTAGRWTQIVIVGAAPNPTEGIAVRRSRTLLLPRDERKG